LPRFFQSLAMTIWCEGGRANGWGKRTAPTKPSWILELGDWGGER